MAFFDCHFFSEALGLTVAAHVLIPQESKGQIGMAGGQSRERYPVLYLLHGLSDDQTIWSRRTSIERYAAARNLAVVMPAAARSFYQDMASGPRYWSYISEELPALMARFFPIATEREQTFAAGLSMGGYGALRLALAQPRRFGAAASLSGAIDVARICRTAGRTGSRVGNAEIVSMFGANLDPRGTPADLWHLAREVKKSEAPAPALYLACGTEDGLLGENREFADHLKSLRLDFTWNETPGDHDWAYWDAEIQKVLAWLPLR